MTELELALVVTAVSWLTAHVVALVMLRRRKGAVVMAQPGYSNRESSADGP